MTAVARELWNVAEDLLAEHHVAADTIDLVRPELPSLMDKVIARWGPKERSRLERWGKGEPIDQDFKRWIHGGLVFELLLSYALDKAPDEPDKAEQWAHRTAKSATREITEAAIHFAFSQPTDVDRALMKKSNPPFAIEKETKMAITYYIDARGLPDGFDQNRQTKFLDGVAAELKNSYRTPPKDNEIIHAVVKGMLLLDGHLGSVDGNGDFAADQAFRLGLQKALLETLGKTKLLPGPDGKRNEVTNKDTYEKVASTIPTANGGNEKISFQQLAFVSRYVIENADTVPHDHQDFASQVRIGLDRYVATPALESLDLPVLTGTDGGDVEIVADNVRAVAMVYAGYQLDRGARLFHVVDRITELFMQGLLPIGLDAGGKALDGYYWDAEDRMNEAARYMHYGRVLGTAGGDISKEVQPNKDFDTLFLRFLSSLAEYDRQRRIADVLAQGRGALSLTTEQVRKSGRDLAANVSLYGWAGTHFAARRLNDHIARAVEILKLPQIQKAYGVTNFWQVIERVCTSETGQAPNIVKYRTMAESGKRILDLVAKYTAVWSTTGKPLFQQLDPTGRVATPGDISFNDEQDLLRNTQYWLAVNGVAEDQVDRMAQPSESILAPSMPAFGAVSPGTDGANGDMVQKLQQMVASGNTPTLDQIKQMIPSLRA